MRQIFGAGWPGISRSGSSRQRPPSAFSSPVSSSAVQSHEWAEPGATPREPVDDCDSLMRAFESTVRLRAKELVADPPLHQSGWFPLMRLLAGEGVPVEVSATILGVDVVAYRDWVCDHRMQIDSSGDR